MPTPTAAAAPSLAEHTTLRLGGPAQRLVVASDADQVVAAIRSADAAGESLLVLGGGSNVVIADDGVPGTTVLIASRGRHLDRRDDGGVLLTLEAGEDWDDVVAGVVGEGLGGLECLSGIPGRVGATPVQNVGAYGVEIAELLMDVDLYDRRRDEIRSHVPAGALGLGYRTSALKGRADSVVLRVRLALPGGPDSAPIRYPELAKALGVAVGERVASSRARQAVLALRRGKGMVLDADDRDTWSAGSFFTNPVLPTAGLPLGPGAPLASAPRWPAGEGDTKLSAAWLIDHAGFHRGYEGPGGRVALSGKHVLALTHRGGGTTADLLALAKEVRDGVRGAFGVELRPEPVLVGCCM